MKKEFVPYTEALELKQLGFDEDCFTFYQVEYHQNSPIMVDDNDQYRITGFRTCKNSEIASHYTSCPTYSQAFRWFREKYELYPEINLHDREDEQTWRFSIIILGEYNLVYNQNVVKNPYYKTYEEAELACLQKLIEIVKTK